MKHNKKKHTNKMYNIMTSMYERRRISFLSIIDIYIHTRQKYEGDLERTMLRTFFFRSSLFFLRKKNL